MSRKLCNQINDIFNSCNIPCHVTYWAPGDGFTRYRFHRISGIDDNDHAYLNTTYTHSPNGRQLVDYFSDYGLITVRGKRTANDIADAIKAGYFLRRNQARQHGIEKRHMPKEKAQ